MKRIILLSLSILLITFLNFDTFGEDSSIVDIRNKYNFIEGLQMDSTTVNFELEDDPLTGKVTFYSNGGQVRKIVFESGAEHGGGTDSFYYTENQLFFVFKAESNWGFTGNTLPNGESETADTLKELRFYFQNGQCIRSLTREAKNTNADLLGKQISKLPNLPFSDPELINRIQKSGAALLGLRALLG